MDTYDVFKLVIGLVVGIFFLYFMVNFSGLYSTFQEKSIDVAHLSNLKTIIQNVYTSDVPVTLELKIDAVYDPSSITAFFEDGGFTDLDIPVLFFYKTSPKDSKVIVYRSSFMEGFVEIPFVGIFPETSIFFNILDYKGESWKAARDISSFLPSSKKPAFIYGFCINDNERIPYTKEYFSPLMDSIVEHTKTHGNEYVPLDTSFAPCTQSPEKSILVVVSKNAGVVGSAFVIDPVSEDLGKVVFSERTADIELVYKDPLDVFAVIVGGQKAYTYKNREVFRFLEIAVASEIERVNNLIFHYQEPKYNRQECVKLYSDALAELQKWGKKINEVEESEDYNDLASMTEYVLLRKRVAENYDELERGGCE